MQPAVSPSVRPTTDAHTHPTVQASPVPKASTPAPRASAPVPKPVSPVPGDVPKEREPAARAASHEPGDEHDAFFDQGDEGTYHGGPNSNLPPPDSTDAVEPVIPRAERTPEQRERTRRNTRIVLGVLAASVVIVLIGLARMKSNSDASGQGSDAPASPPLVQQPPPPAPPPPPPAPVNTAPADAGAARVEPEPPPPAPVAPPPAAVAPRKPAAATPTPPAAPAPPPSDPLLDPLADEPAEAARTGIGGKPPTASYPIQEKR
jgi:hypothetical protein